MLFMTRVARAAIKLWPSVMPNAAALVLVSSGGRDVGQPVEGIGVVMVTVGAVLAAVRQAVTVALRVDEPAGSPLRSRSPLTRDTVFAAAMITVNGIVGVSLLVGSFRFGMVPLDPWDLLRHRRLKHSHQDYRASRGLGAVYVRVSSPVGPAGSPERSAVSSAKPVPRWPGPTWASARIRCTMCG